MNVMIRSTYRSAYRLFPNKENFWRSSLHAALSIGRQISGRAGSRKLIWHFDLSSGNDSGSSRIIYANSLALAIYGHSLEQLQALPSLWIDLAVPPDRERLRSTILDHKNLGQPFSIRINRPDGSPRWIRYQALLSNRNGHDYLELIGTDITTREHMEMALIRSNRALRAIQDCEHVLSEAVDEKALLEGICSVVRATGYRLAWVGIINRSGNIEAVGLTENHQAYYETLKEPLQEGGKGTHAIAKALRTGRPSVANYFASDMQPTPWREEAMRLGFHSKLVLPMFAGQDALGIINVYASEPDAFDLQEVTLLSGLAQRLAASIQSHRHRSGRELAEAALRLRERALDCSASGVVIWNTNAPDFAIEYVNPAFERITGYSAAEVVGKNSRFLLGEDQEQAGLKQVKKALSEKRECQVLVRNRRQDGALLWTDLHIAPVMTEQGRTTHFVAAMNDVTALKQYEARLQKLANYDVLTGLPNRALLQDRLEQGIAASSRNGSSVWVAFVDLDRFKLVNDTMGHQTGDALLKIISGRLQAAVRESDTVARLGGDEFVLVLPECGNAVAGHASDVIHRIMDAVVKPLSIEGNEYYLSCSLGIAVYPNDGKDAATLMAHADVAMYRAKEMGRNTFQFYTPGMNEHAMGRLRIECELRQALERKELILHYQPQLDLHSGKVVGLEALLRWKHPVKGMIPPADFIGLAEETGLIVPIGAWVLETACRQARSWHDMGFNDLRVAVNLSARQFLQASLVGTVKDILKDSRLPPESLEIELTESSVVNDVERSLATLKELKSLGIQLAIDDFGTGYSSLSYLRRFPINTLKIDRSFVRDIAVNKSDASIVSSIINLAHNLDMKVIAEGVETSVQADILRGQFCDELQGYYICRPIPPDEVMPLLTGSKDVPRAIA